MANMLHGTGISTYICLRCIIKCWQIFPTWSILEHLSMWLFHPPQKCSTQFTLTKKTWAPQHHLVHRHLVRFVVLAISQRRFNSHLLKNKNILPETNSKKKLKENKGGLVFRPMLGGFWSFFVFRKGYPPVKFKSHQNSPELQKTTPSLSKSFVLFFWAWQVVSKLEFGKVFKGNVF